MLRVRMLLWHEPFEDNKEAVNGGRTDSVYSISTVPSSYFGFLTTLTTTI